LVAGESHILTQDFCFVERNIFYVSSTGNKIYFIEKKKKKKKLKGKP